MRAVAAIARRELREVMADRWTAVSVTVMPLVIGAVLTALYAGRIVAEEPVGVIDEDRSGTSRALIRALDAHQTLRAEVLDVPAAEAEGLIASGGRAAVIVIPEDLERTMKNGQQGAVLCLLNNSNMVVGNAVLKAVSTTGATVSAGAAIGKANRGGATGAAGTALAVPVAVSVRTMFNPAGNYSDFFVPGILAALLQQVVVIGAALTWVREFRTGRITEALAVTRSAVVLATGKLLVYAGIGAAWGVVFFCGFFPLVGVPYTGSIAGGVAATLLMLIAMGLIAMLISSFCEHRETAVQVTFIVSSPAFLVSGYTFPASAMTDPAAWAGAIIPLTPFLTAWRRLVLYGAGLGDVLPQLGLLVLMIAVLAVAMQVQVRRRLGTFSGSRPVTVAGAWTTGEAGR